MSRAEHPVGCSGARWRTMPMAHAAMLCCAGLVSVTARRKSSLSGSWRSDDRIVALRSPSTLSAESHRAGGRRNASCWRSVTCRSPRGKTSSQWAANGLCLPAAGLFASGDGDSPIRGHAVGRSAVGCRRLRQRIVRSSLSAILRESRPRTRAMSFSMRPAEAPHHRPSRFGIAFDGGPGIAGNGGRRFWRRATGSSRTFSISRTAIEVSEIAMRCCRTTLCRHEALASCRGAPLVFLAVANRRPRNSVRAVQHSDRKPGGKEANLKGQAQGGLFNRWTFDQQKSGEAPAGFSMLVYGRRAGCGLDYRYGRGCSFGSTFSGGVFIVPGG